jgi:hypothetical protein
MASGQKVARREVKRDSKPSALVLPVRHLTGCPKSRVESFHAIQPPRPARGLAEQPITITRCIECGEQTARLGRLWEGDKIPKEEVLLDGEEED